MEESDPRIGTKIDGRYRLKKRLGAGGMGVVYQAEQIGIKKAVAVKFLHESLVGSADLVKRFKREVAAMSRLAHPHLVSIFDAGVAGDVPYLVMDFTPGRPLSDVLDGGALLPARAAEVARQILSGVGHAHRNGIVHRDLKPDNVLLLDDVKEDFIKILDFGLAKMTHGEGEGLTQLTNTGFAIGTPSYMSPEQAKGGRTDERSDIYAVGTILYQMLVGRKVFIGESPMSVLRMHIDEPPVPPRQAAPAANISAALESAVLRALEKDPARRFQTTEEFAAAIGARDGEQSSAGLNADPTDVELSPLPHAALQYDDSGDSGVIRGDDSTLPAPRKLRWRRGFFVLVFAGGAVAAVTGWMRLSSRQRENVQRHLGTAYDEAKGSINELSQPPSAAQPEPPAKAASGAALQQSAKAPAPVAVNAPAPIPAAPRPSAPTAIAAAPAKENNGDSDDDDAAPPPRDAPGARLEAASLNAAHATTAPLAAPQATRKPPKLQDAVRLVSQGKMEDALPVLYALRRKNPKNPDVALQLGHVYFKKLWRTDALREYDSAIQWRPSLQKDKGLIKNAVIALDDPTYKPARALIQGRIGAAAVPELNRVAHEAGNPKVQKRATVLAAALSHPPRKSHAR